MNPPDTIYVAMSCKDDGHAKTWNGDRIAWCAPCTCGTEPVRYIRATPLTDAAPELLARSPKTLDARADRLAANAHGTWWNSLTDAKRKFLLGDVTAMADAAFSAGAKAGILESDFSPIRKVTTP